MLTINQATAVMAAGIPVKFRGMEFLRIIGVSKKLNDHNVVLPSVALEDRVRRTVYHADPAEVTMHGEVDGIYYELVGDEVRAVKGGGGMKVTNLYKPSEDDEQAAVIDFCNLFGIDVIHIPNEGKRSPATAAKLKRLGLRPGVPDLFFPIPSGEYHGLFIEMKAQGGRPTSDQKRWITKLSAKGYRATVCVGADAAICEIRNYLQKEKRK